MHWKESMAKVYVIQEDKYKDFSSAQEFGELTVVMPPGQVYNHPSDFIKAMYDGLGGYDYLVDFLILVGDPVQIGIATAIISELTVGHFNLLKWDRQERKYIPITIDLGAI